MADSGTIAPPVVVVAAAAAGAAVVAVELLELGAAPLADDVKPVSVPASTGSTCDAVPVVVTVDPAVVVPAEVTASVPASVGKSAAAPLVFVSALTCGVAAAGAAAVVAAAVTVAGIDVV